MGTIWNNHYFWIPLTTWFLVQTIKVITELIAHKRFDFKRFWGSGGMPSSHSATVTSLATVAGLARGFDSLEFAMCVAFAAITMYDAAGVRRAAGKQARVLNQIMESKGNINMQEKLIELLGHTPVEVFVGAIVGIVTALALYNVWV